MTFITETHRKEWDALSTKGKAERIRRAEVYRNKQVVPELLRAWGIVGAIPPAVRARHSALKGE